MRIRLYEISKMLQIRIKLPKSGAYWGHCSLKLCLCLLTTPILASQCGWLFVGLCWVDPYKSIESPICLLSGQSCLWKKRNWNKPNQGLLHLRKKSSSFKFGRGDQALIESAETRDFPQHRAGCGDAYSMVWLILEIGLREYSTMLWAGGNCSSYHVFYVGGTATGR